MRREREQRKNRQLCLDRETARSGLLRRWSFLQGAAGGNGGPPGEVKSAAAQCQCGSQWDLGQHGQQESDFVKSKFGLLSILVTYRLNPAFSVTNLSSSSTSGEGKKQNKRTSELNNSKKKRSATAKVILCSSQFTIHKPHTCWEVPLPQISASGPHRDHSALVTAEPPRSRKHNSLAEGRFPRLPRALSDLLYCGLPQRAAGSWLACRWCPSPPESAGCPEPAPGSAGPCTSPGSTSSSVSPRW